MTTYNNEELKSINNEELKSILDGLETLLRFIDRKRACLMRMNDTLDELSKLKALEPSILPLYGLYESMDRIRKECEELEETQMARIEVQPEHKP